MVSGEMIPGAGLSDAVRQALRRSSPQSQAIVSSGFGALDGLLPAGGIRRGSLVEWLLPGGLAGGFASSGGLTLACAVAMHVSDGLEERSPTVVVVDRLGRFHPPAVFPWMAEPRGGRNRVRLVVARPPKDDDETWTIDQALRCPGVSAVLAWPRRIHPTAMRRWQLAARSSGAIGLIARRLEDRREASWAESRLVVSPLPIDSPGRAGSPSPVALRAWRISKVAGAIDFEERSALVAIDMAVGREWDGFRRSDGKRAGATARRKEVLQCHAS